MKEHVCNATVPVCECGRKWEYRVEYATGDTFTDSQTVNRYLALYGKPETLKFTLIKQHENEKRQAH